MAVTQEQYQSEYGWAMNVPSGWQLLPPSRGQVLAVHRPVVFCHDDNFDLWLTWMIASHSVPVEAAQKFEAIAERASGTEAELREVAPTLFPVIGKIDSCEMVHLADSTLAIEVIDSYEEEGEKKHGYQLIFPLKDGAADKHVFQRLTFFAPAADFARHLPDIRAAARSFRYMRPYGWRPPQAQ